MSKSAVPDWFGKDAPQTPEPPRHSGGPRGPLVGAAVVSLLCVAVGVWFVTAKAPPPSDVSVEPGRTATHSANPQRDKLLEEIAKAAGNPAEEPDLSELPSIDEIVEAADLPPEDGDDETEIAPRSAKAVMQVVRSLKPKTQTCYAQELERNPHAAGKVEVTFTIDPAGRVTKTESSPGGMLPWRIVRCIEAVLRQAEFGAASEPATVKMPFVFALP